jgi:hypothetical protein
MAVCDLGCQIELHNAGVRKKLMNLRSRTIYRAVISPSCLARSMSVYGSEHGRCNEHTCPRGVDLRNSHKFIATWKRVGTNRMECSSSRTQVGDQPAYQRIEHGDGVAGPLPASCHTAPFLQLIIEHRQGTST